MQAMDNKFTCCSDYAASCVRNRFVKFCKWNVIRQEERISDFANVRRNTKERS